MGHLLVKTQPKGGTTRILLGVSEDISLSGNCNSFTFFANIASLLIGGGLI